MGSQQSSMQTRTQRKSKPTQHQLQREYQRHLDNQQAAREALEASLALNNRGHGAQSSSAGGRHPKANSFHHAPSVMTSNESFYPQRSTNNNSAGNGQDFVWIDGRRHHPSSVLPSDLEECDRLHLQHYVVRHAFGGNTRSGFDPHVHRDVLDVGCGPGTWILEMSTENSEVNFTGIDISAVWPTEIRPRNCRFQVVNALEGLPFQDNTFDFVYQRFMLLAYPARDWPFILSELVRVAKPGGVIELTEMPLTISPVNSGPEIARAMKILEAGCMDRGLDSKLVKKLEQMMIQSGVVSVKACHASIPVGDWGGRVGQLMRENSAALWASLKGWIKEISGMDEPHYEQMVKKIFEEYEVYKCYVNCYCAWGIKPFPEGSPQAIAMKKKEQEEAAKKEAERLERASLRTAASMTDLSVGGGGSSSTPASPRTKPRSPKASKTNTAEIVANLSSSTLPTTTSTTSLPSSPPVPASQTQQVPPVPMSSPSQSLPPPPREVPTLGGGTPSLSTRGTKSQYQLQQSSIPSPPPAAHPR